MSHQTGSVGRTIVDKVGFGNGQNRVICINGRIGRIRLVTAGVTHTVAVEVSGTGHVVLSAQSVGGTPPAGLAVFAHQPGTDCGTVLQDHVSHAVAVKVGHSLHFPVIDAAHIGLAVSEAEGKSVAGLIAGQQISSAVAVINIQTPIGPTSVFTISSAVLPVNARRACRFRLFAVSYI